MIHQIIRKVTKEVRIELILDAYFHYCSRSIAEYLSCDHPFKLSPDDVYITVGGRQAIDVVLTVLARPGANILLPKPGYSFYDARATFSHLEIRHFDLLPEQEWEIDLNHVEALADDKTVAIVIINPGNPCGNVYTYEHLQKVHFYTFSVVGSDNASGFQTYLLVKW